MALTDRNIQTENAFPNLSWFALELQQYTNQKIATASHNQSLASILGKFPASDVLKELHQADPALFYVKQFGELYATRPNDESTCTQIRWRIHQLRKWLTGAAVELSGGKQTLENLLIEIGDFFFNVESQLLASAFRVISDSLNDSLHFTQKIVDTIPGIIFIFDLETFSEVYVNRTVESMFGYSAEEMDQMGKNLLSHMIHPDDIAGIQQKPVDFREAQDHAVIEYEFRLKNRAGNYSWVRTYESIFKRKAGGMPVQVIGIAIDISHEKHTSSKLEEKEKQLLEAQEVAGIGSYLVDIPGFTGEFSDQACAILNVGRHASLQECIERMNPADRPMLRDAIQKAVQDNGYFETECRFNTTDGWKALWLRGYVQEADGRRMLRGTVMDITARYTLLKKLEENDRLYRKAEALSHLGNWSWDVQENKVYWSEELWKIYGLQPGAFEINFENYLSLIHPDDREKMMGIIQRSMKTLEPYEASHRVMWRDGTIRYIQAWGQLTVDEKGEVTTVFGTAQDITEKQMLINKLEESERLYKQAAAITQVGNYKWDVKTGKVIWSDEMYSIHEIPFHIKEINYDFLVSMTHPQDLDRARGIVDQALKERKSYDIIYRIITPGKKIKIVNTKADFIFDEKDNLKEVVGTMQDCTERQLLLEKLQNSENLYKQAQALAHIGNWSWNVTEHSYTLSEELFRIFGIPTNVSNFTITDFLDHLDKDEKSRLQEILASAIALREPFSITHHYNHPSGVRKTIRVLGEVQEVPETGALLITGTSQDITGQERIEQQLRQKQAELEQSNTSLKEYAYVASHDLQEPLRKISTFADRLKSSLPANLPAEGKNYLDKIISSSVRMQQMIRDLLSVSVISSERSFEKINLNVLLQEVIQDLEHRMENNKVTIETDTLPEARVIAAQFRQLFQNLLSNSIKFARKDVPCRIEIRFKYLKNPPRIRSNTSEQDYLCISFIDNGIGFDNQYAEKIFNIFQRLHGKHEYEGTGIGLAICRRIAENHGGIIEAAGQPHNGALFTIIIPS